jgi:hypothetical protein
MTTDFSLNYIEVQYMKIPSSNMGRTCCVQKLFLTFRTIFVQTSSPHVLQKEELLTKIYMYRKMTNSPESIEAVNGKIDMGTRKLKAAYVENATTLYAYLEADFHVLKEYMDTFSEVYKTASEIDDKIIEGEIYLIYSDKDKCAARARIEQPKAGPAGTKVNF